MSSLFEKCYENFLGFDLKSFHKRNSIPSEYHMIDGRPLKIEDLPNEKISFNDGLSTNFQLINFENKNYLLGEKSCYPCSIVYENTQGYRWVDLIIIPNGERLMFTQKKSVIRYNAYNVFDSFSNIIDQNLINSYLDNYVSTFGKNDWFDRGWLVPIITKSSIPFLEMFKLLYSWNLLNPFQLSLSSIFYGFNLSNENIINAIKINNHIGLGIDYLPSPKSKLKFSNSTIKLVSEEYFIQFINSLSQEEVDLFFELDYLKENLELKTNYLDLIFDVLNLKDLDRNDKNELEIPGWKYKPIMLNSVGINEFLIEDYYKRLKLNLRLLENNLRKNKGYNLIGSLYNESLLFRLVEENLPQYTILSQYSPIWLGRQRFDIFIKEINVAIEYNGKQHYEPVEFFGGEDGFNYTQERDRQKREKCISNNCKLIEIKYDETLEEALLKIKSIIGMNR